MSMTIEFSDRVQKALVKVKGELPSGDMDIYLREVLPKIFQLNPLHQISLMSLQGEYQIELTNKTSNFLKKNWYSTEITALQRKIKIMDKVIGVVKKEMQQEKVAEEEIRERNKPLTCGQKAWRATTWLCGNAAMGVQKAWPWVVSSLKVTLLLVPRTVLWVGQHTVVPCFRKCCCRSKTAIIATSSTISTTRAESKEEEGEWSRKLSPVLRSVAISLGGIEAAEKTIAWVYAILGDVQVVQRKDVKEPSYTFVLEKESYEVSLREGHWLWKGNKIPFKKLSASQAQEMKKRFSHFLTSDDATFASLIVDKLFPPNMESCTLWLDGRFEIQYKKSQESPIQLNQSGGWNQNINATLYVADKITGKIDFKKNEITFGAKAIYGSYWGVTADLETLQVDDSSNVSVTARLSGAVSVVFRMFGVERQNSATFTPAQFRGTFAKVHWG